MRRLVDAHCHLEFDAFDPDRDDVMRRAREAGVVAIVAASVDADSSARTRALCDGEVVFGCAGIHPWWVDRLGDAELDAELERLERELDGREVAIGEIGLDWASLKHSGAPRSRQLRAFDAQLDLALARDLPCVVHAVRCHGDMLTHLSTRDRIPPLLMHGWSGAPHMVEHFARLGAHFSFGAPLTTEGYRKVKRSLRAVYESWPERLLLESDAPDGRMHPEVRGEPCEVAWSSKGAAKFLDASVEEVDGLSVDNASRFFGVSFG